MTTSRSWLNSRTSGFKDERMLHPGFSPTETSLFLFFLSLFVQGIDESGGEKTLSFPWCPSPPSRLLPSLSEATAALTPWSYIQGVTDTRSCGGRWWWAANLSRGGSSYPERKRHRAIFRPLKTQRRHEMEDIFFVFLSRCRCRKAEISITKARKRMSVSCRADGPMCVFFRLFITLSCDLL